MRSVLRLLVGSLSALIGLLLLAITGIYLLVWSSLPDYEGFRSSSNIEEAVIIDRDKWGVPQVTSDTHESVSYGIGFCHGQDRFFQMDMTRRIAAGELSAILGVDTLELDKKTRVHGFREHAKLLWENLSDTEKVILEKYTLGVNEGLNSLKTRPPEYWLLQEKPEPWLPEDSLLILFSYYLELGNIPELDYSRWIARQTLPREVVQFLDHSSHSWEATIDGTSLPQPEIPGPEVFTYLKPTPMDSTFLHIPLETEEVVGSNNWAVGPEATTSGFPLLANDPHLNLSVPNTWYKISYRYKTAAGKDTVELHGFSIPGQPGIIIGSNGNIAWGVTNSSLDTDDLIILEPTENGFPEYKTPEGNAQIQHRRELIKVKGQAPVTVEIPYTRWGPVIGDTPNGLKRVRRWAAYHPEAGNLGLQLAETSRTTKEFLEQIHSVNLPVQNVVIADKTGHIAWTLVGFLPDRQGADPFQAIYSSKADKIWTRKLAPKDWPMIQRPDSHRLWTANNRVAGNEKYLKLGNGEFAESPRAYQIREQLMAQEKHTPRTMAAIQHDNSVTFLLRWRTILLDTLAQASEPQPEFTRIRSEVEAWNGRAETSSIGYTLIRDFRSRVSVEVIRHITGPAIEFDAEGFKPFRFSTEEAVYKIVSEQPDYLLNPIYKSWQQQFETIVSEQAERIRSHGWEDFRWGRRNRSDYKHTLTYGVPALNSLLNMPQMELNGDHYCPKVLSHSLAGGLRMILSPGQLENSSFQMACGQSGHPMSSHYRDLHGKWSGETYLPFLPGPTVHTLTISPN